MAKSARYEAKIAKMEAELAAARREYGAHQAATGARLTPEQRAGARAGTFTGRTPTAYQEAKAKLDAARAAAGKNNFVGVDALREYYQALSTRRLYTMAKDAPSSVFGKTPDAKDRQGLIEYLLGGSIKPINIFNRG